MHGLHAIHMISYYVVEFGRREGGKNRGMYVPVSNSNNRCLRNRIRIPAVREDRRLTTVGREICIDNRSRDVIQDRRA